MDSICKEILIEKTKCHKIIDVFEICGFTDIKDIVHIDDTILDEMERFFGDYLSFQSEKSTYLEDGLIYIPHSFRIVTGIRIDILEAIKMIKEELKNQSIKTNNTDLSLNEHNTSSSSGSLNQSHVVSNDEVDVSVDVKEPEIVPNRELVPYTINLEKKKIVLEDWSKNIAERIAKKYKNAHVQYQVDFDLDVDYVTKAYGPKLTGLYKCLICQELCGRVKEIKFSLYENYIILSNVMTHLKSHYCE